MRNAITVVFAAILVIFVVVAVVVNFNIRSDKEADSYYVAVEEKIIEENMNENKDGLKDFKTFYVLDKYGMKKEENKIYLYAYVVAENYYKNDEGKVVLYSGYAIPHRFEFENGEYVGEEIPKDGTYYESSLKELYPLNIRIKMEFFKDNEKLVNNIKHQVEEYYGISYDEIII